MEQRLTCPDCGSTKWRLLDKAVLLSYPPITVCTYECVTCNRQLTVKNQEKVSDIIEILIDDQTNVV